MKYVSIDIETTGLNPLTCDILEVGAYLEDTDNMLLRNELPTFHKYLWKDNYRGEPFALSMNAHILKKIFGLNKISGVGQDTDINSLLINPDVLWLHFKQWIYSCRKIWKESKIEGNYFINEIPTLVVAGKNVAGFDLPFLSQLSGMPKFHHRVIDPGMVYFDPRNDEVPPDLAECKKRAKLPGGVSHDALDDAWDVIQLVREKYPVI